MKLTPIIAENTVEEQKKDILAAMKRVGLKPISKPEPSTSHPNTLVVSLGTKTSFNISTRTLSDIQKLSGASNLNISFSSGEVILLFSF